MWNMIDVAVGVILNADVASPRMIMFLGVEVRDGEDHRSLILISKIFANDLDLLCDLDSWQ